MAETVITPADKTLVVDSGRNNDYGRQGPTWSAEPTFGQTADAIHTSNNTSHLLNAMLTQFGFMREGFGDVNQTVQNDGHFTREGQRAESRHLAEQLAANSNYVKEQLSDHRMETTRDFGNTNLTVVNTANAVRAELAASIADGKTQNIIGFKDARYDACMNAAAIAKQLAECCCEIKEKVGSDGQATRDLINSGERARLAQDLADAKQEINLLKLSVSVGGPGRG